MRKHECVRIPRVSSYNIPTKNKRRARFSINTLEFGGGKPMRRLWRIGKSQCWDNAAAKLGERKSELKMCCQGNSTKLTSCRNYEMYHI